MKHFETVAKPEMCLVGWGLGVSENPDFCLKKYSFNLSHLYLNFEKFNYI
jgi:hypothetical protein